jgi:hypothetical protein
MKPQRVLNVGGNSRSIVLPSVFDGWEQHLLDIDPACNPDILADARQLEKLEPSQYQAIYCSHNLEHYYAHEVPSVLHGFQHLLVDQGFAFIRVPDIPEVMQSMLARDLDLEDTLYDSPKGPISTRDVLYGHGGEIARSGNDFFAHKTGFSKASLLRTLKKNGFTNVYTATAQLEIRAIAFLQPPTPEQRASLGL